MHIASILRITGAVIATVVLASTAHAQLFRAYLSPAGNDANNCTLPTPCRLLPAALTAVADGGEIWMLGSANYNTATVDINKSVNILAVPGVVGSVVATGGPAISIATAGVKVSLRNLVIAPLAGGGGTNGINMTNGYSLVIENSEIANLPIDGVFVSGAANVRVTDTTIRDNGNDGVSITDGALATVTRAVLSGNAVAGIRVEGSLAATTTTADIADTTIDENHFFGVYAITSNASAVVKVSVRDSRSVRNSSHGVIATAPVGFATAAVSNCILSNNGGTGILSLNANAKVWASGNTVSGNNVGFSSVLGVFESAGNNSVRNNTTDISGNISVIPQT